MESLDALEAALGICLRELDEVEDTYEDSNDTEDDYGVPQEIPDYERVCNFFVWFRSYFEEPHCISIWGAAFGKNMYKFLCKPDIDNRAELVWDHYRDKDMQLRKIVNMYRKYLVDSTGDKQSQYMCTFAEVTEYSQMFLYYSYDFNNEMCGKIWPRLKSPVPGAKHHIWQKYLGMIDAGSSGKKRRMLRMPCVTVLYGALDRGNRELMVSYWRKHA